MNPRQWPQDQLSPALERLWIDEVQYLHNLWRLGPPPNPNSNPSPKPNAVPGPNPNPNLRPTNRTTFKKGSKKKKGKKKKNIEWPIPTQPEPPQETGWPAMQLPEPSRPATAEELAKQAAIELQQNGLRACRDFFSKKIDGEEEEDQMDDEEESQSENLSFFLGLFSGDGALRRYYEKNWERGEFFCLVCGGIREKVGKRYGNCVALVQHANAISKTKRRVAHRAFGQAICRVLGWEMNRLPSIVLDLGEPLGQSLSSQVDVQHSVAADESDVLKEIGESVEAAVGQEASARKEVVNPLAIVVAQEEAHQKKIVEHVGTSIVKQEYDDEKFVVLTGSKSMELMDCR